MRQKRSPSPFRLVRIQMYDLFDASHALNAVRCGLSQCNLPDKHHMPRCDDITPKLASLTLLHEMSSNSDADCLNVIS